MRQKKARVYSQDLIIGEHYNKLKKCISIAILDFNLTERKCGHEIYTLLNKNGESYSDLMEIHTIELRKTDGFSPELAEWIEFLNAREESNLESLRAKTRNEGIMEAIDELRRFGLIGNFRAMWEEYIKAKRDRNAEDDYVRDEGIAIGEAKGRAEGRAEGRADELATLVNEHLLAYDVALERSGLPKEKFDKLINKASEG